ncbi:MAG TPA: DNA-binding response regulator [Cytophagales bacterium]|nr:DNA-binding response regulator [Cytophagales bacterium]
MNVLVIEDEVNVAAFIKKGLEEENYQVETVQDGMSVLALLGVKPIDLIILDIILPGINGIELCKKIRQNGFKDVPVLMLTALNSTDDVVKGLNAGADDYLAKPFKFAELLARINALTRRMNLTQNQEENLQVADLKLDRNAKVAIRAGKEIKLTSTEYRLLEHLMINKRKVLSRSDLLENVWDIRFDVGTNVLDVYVNYLRNKIDKGFDTKLIQTVIGMGYVIKDET